MTNIINVDSDSNGSPKRAGLMRIFCSLLTALLFATSLSAQTTNTVHIAGRYLFVVETSSAMRKRMDNAWNSVRYLMTRRLTNELRAGDSVGVWTFNETLHSGEFPLQIWTPANGEMVSSNMVGFLKTKRPEKGAKMEEVVRALGGLVRHSEKLTVILISSGDVPIKGTPYDAPLNETYKRNAKDLKKNNLPFVTVLRGWNGSLIGGSVAWQPWPIELPQFPPDPEIVHKAQEEAAPAAPRPSLIVIGEKPAPAVVIEPAPAPQATETNAPAVTEPVSPEPVPIQLAPPEPVVAPPPAPVKTPVPPEPVPPPVVTKAPPAPAQPAVALPVEHKSGPTLMIGVGIGLLLAGIILIYLLIRRGRNIARKSLITQSMERGQK